MLQQIPNGLVINLQIGHIELDHILRAGLEGLLTVSLPARQCVRTMVMVMVRARLRVTVSVNLGVMIRIMIRIKVSVGV